MLITIAVVARLSLWTKAMASKVSAPNRTTLADLAR